MEKKEEGKSEPEQVAQVVEEKTSGDAAPDAPKEKFFEDLEADSSFTEIESLCMNCHEQGTTRLLLTKIPFFKEIVVMAFHCPHCEFRSTEVQSASSIAERGCLTTLRVTCKEDLNRQIVKSDTATLTIPDLDFVIPSITQRGQLNTVEGYLMQASEALRAGQEERRKIDPETTAKLDAFLDKLDACSRGEMEFSVTLDDPAGNSFLENPYAPQQDPRAHIVHYKRTRAQNESVGMDPDAVERSEAEPKPEGVPVDESEVNLEHYGLDFDTLNYKKVVMSFQGTCPGCGAPVETRMIAVDIPYFKEMIIMASMCDNCGYKSNEVKAGGAISPKGRKITLTIKGDKDLNRDILKSETAVVIIPQIELEMSHGSQGGRFTTVEGLLTGIKEDLVRVNPWVGGDSRQEGIKEKYTSYIEGIDKLLECGKPFDLILDDPVANSYVQNLCTPDPDPQMVIEEYERSWEQNEELGLNDMKTEDY